MTGKLKESYDNNKLIYWILGAMLTVLVSMTGVLVNGQNERFDKIERSLSNRPTRDYVKDRLEEINNKIETSNEFSQEQLKRLNERQDETIEKINEIYIFMLKERNDGRR